jgi:NTE family protein
MAISNKSKNVALVLSSGGARGLAHIGVIEELVDRGYSINSIAGSSMGALVGGLYATNNLRKFRDWVVTLDKLDIFKLIDFTVSSQGFIKGDKIFHKMQEMGMIPNVKIEDLSIFYTAVATDITKNQEVIFSSGDLLKAIRASISIPNVFTPIKENSSILVDGGVLNPMPINRIARTKDDILIAVDLNSLNPYIQPTSLNKEKKEKTHNDKTQKLIKKWDELFGIQHIDKSTKSKSKNSEPSYFDILAASIQLMQARLTQQSLENIKPDILVNISKNSCSVFEFYKGEEMINYGHEACKKALAEAGL